MDRLARRFSSCWRVMLILVSALLAPLGQSHNTNQHAQDLAADSVLRVLDFQLWHGPASGGIPATDRSQTLSVSFSTEGGRTWEFIELKRVTGLFSDSLRVLIDGEVQQSVQQPAVYRRVLRSGAIVTVVVFSFAEKLAQVSVDKSDDLNDTVFVQLGSLLLRQLPDTAAQTRLLNEAGEPPALVAFQRLPSSAGVGTCGNDDARHGADSEGPLALLQQGIRAAVGNAPQQQHGAARSPWDGGRDPVFPSGLLNHETVDLDPWTGCYPGFNTGRFLRMGLVVDKGFYDAAGGSSGSVQAVIAEIVARTNNIYWEQLHIWMRVDTILMASTTGYDFRTAPGATTSSGAPDINYYPESVHTPHTCPSGSGPALTEMYEWTSRLPQSAKDDHDLWHHLLDCGVTYWTFPSGGFTTGRGYGSGSGPVTCRKSGTQTAVTTYYHSTWETFSHEVGHNLGFNHTWICNDPPSCSSAEGTHYGGVMDYGSDSPVLPTPDSRVQFNRHFHEATVCGALSPTLANNAGCMPAFTGATCGNGIREPGEACDDGPTSPGGCCNAQCQLAGECVAGNGECCDTSTCHWKGSSATCTHSSGVGFCNVGECDRNFNLCRYWTGYSVCSPRTTDVRDDGCYAFCEADSTGTCEALEHTLRFSSQPASRWEVPDGSLCLSTATHVGSCLAGVCNSQVRGTSAPTTAPPATTAAPTTVAATTPSPPPTCPTLSSTATTTIVTAGGCASKTTGNQCRFQCKAGLTVKSGSTTRTCGTGSSPQWNGSPLVCEYVTTSTTAAPTEPPTTPTTVAPTDPPTTPTTVAPTDPPTTPTTVAPTDPPTTPTTVAPTDPPTTVTTAAVPSTAAFTTAAVTDVPTTTVPTTPVTTASPSTAAATTVTAVESSTAPATTTIATTVAPTTVRQTTDPAPTTSRRATTPVPQTTTAQTTAAPAAATTAAATTAAATTTIAPTPSPTPRLVIFRLLLDLFGTSIPPGFQANLVDLLVSVLSLTDEVPGDEFLPVRIANLTLVALPTEAPVPSTTQSGGSPAPSGAPKPRSRLTITVELRGTGGPDGKDAVELYAELVKLVGDPESTLNKDPLIQDAGAVVSVEPVSGLPATEASGPTLKPVEDDLPWTLVGAGVGGLVALLLVVWCFKSSRKPAPRIVTTKSGKFVQTPKLKAGATPNMRVQDAVTPNAPVGLLDMGNKAVSNTRLDSKRLSFIPKAGSGAAAAGAGSPAGPRPPAPRFGQGARGPASPVGPPVKGRPTGPRPGGPPGAGGGATSGGPPIGTEVMAQWQDGHYYRAKILAVGPSTYKVLYMEYGTEETIPKSHVRVGEE